jgi:glycine hydroxymethyltransferase
LDEALKISLAVQEQSGPKLKDYVDCLAKNEDVSALRAKVNAFATQFPMPGFDAAEMKYQDPNGPPE